MGVRSEIEANFDFEIVDEFLDHYSLMVDSMELLVLDLAKENMYKRSVEELFRVGNMGVGFNEDSDQIVLVAYELVVEEVEPNVVSYWITREQVQMLIAHINKLVRSGRFFDPGSQFSPKKNGHVS